MKKPAFDISTLDRSTFKKPEPLPPGWARQRGARELAAYRSGKTITRAEAMRAMCYSCLGNAADGAIDCEIPDCPLYPWHPYRGRKVKKSVTDDL